MLLQYGCVSLNCLHVHKYEKVAVYDGPNYVYTKINLVVEAVFNPGTQQDSWAFTPAFNAANVTGLAYVPNVSNPNAQGGNRPGGGITPFVGPPNFSNPAGSPQIRAGIPGVISESAVRHALMQPRQQLVFSIGGLVSVYSPLGGFQTDAVGGPTPIACNVTSVSGSRTMTVQYAIETCVNECPIYANQPPVLLSHTWKMTHTLDTEFFTRRVIEGRAIMRMDALVRLGATPDNYRAILGIERTRGWVREKVEIIADRQPNVIEYVVVDREIPIGWNEPGVTRINAVHAVRAGRSKVGEQMLGAIKETISGAASTAGDFSASGPGSFVAGLSGLVTFGLPTNSHVVSVELWGSTETTRNRLEKFGRRIIKARLEAVALKIGLATGKSGFFLSNLSRLFAGFDMEVVHDLLNVHVKVEFSLITGPWLSLFGGGDSYDPLNSGVDLGVFPVDDETNYFFNGETVDLLSYPENENSYVSGPPGDGNLRGSSLSQCLCAAFAGSCDKPLQFDQIDARPVSAQNPISSTPYYMPYYPPITAR